MPRRGFSMVYSTTSGSTRLIRNAAALPSPPAKRSSTSSRCRARRPVFLISSEHSSGSSAVSSTGVRLTATSTPRTIHHGKGAETATTPASPAATTYSQPAPEFMAIRYITRPRQETKAGFTILLMPGRLMLLRGRRYRVEDLPDHGLRPRYPTAYREPVRQGVGR